MENAIRVYSIEELVEKIEKSIVNHIYVEYNGTWSLTDFIRLIQSRMDARIHNVYVMDLDKIHTYMKNFSAMIMEQINYVDEIVTTREGNPREFKYVKQTVAQIRPWISYRSLEKAKLR